ncbi:CRISPR-associated protein Cas5 [Acidianus brierleyi]|uniref:Type I-B CRISPR-associated protein Cas5 n=1 Tax=Acidianus brierleyi TaxID=41673 RepID=A0A2U9IH82_9CREN|nr:CRISPR-associated protein Cas5 [Acidianus brierleyi]AWR95403.1 CRISPR-associated protein Cas5 [Acidianus brierleyi]
MEKILSIQIFSKLAHFRKVFSNSTSLSYYFPPRTTIMGIVAAAMGKDKDSYYDELDKFNYAVEALTPLKKLVFGESYLDTDSVNVQRFRGVSNRVPTTKEFISPSRGNFLGYDIYITYNKNIEEAFKRPKYPLTLGTAEMLAWIEKIEMLECQEENDFSDNEVYGVFPSSFSIETGSVITLEYSVPRRYENERMSGKLYDYFFSTNTSPVKVKTGKGNGIKCNEGKKNILFL